MSKENTPAYVFDFTGVVEFNEDVAELARWFTKVGVVGSSKNERHELNPEVTVAQIAAWNEFGTKNGHIPSRPFMKEALADNKKALVKQAEKAVYKYLMGKLTAKQVLGILGESQTYAIQHTIEEFDTPENAESTIRLKGDDNPLIHKRQLIQSIHHVEVKR